MHFGERIRAARDERGWSASDLAREAGVDASLISTYESGKRKEPAAPYLVKLSKALGVTAEWLLTGEGPMFRDDDVAEGPIDAGFRRFREFVRDREPQHLSLVPEFLEWRARGASRYPATISALDVEEELVTDFRRWRRGRDVGDGMGAQMIRSKTGRALPGTE